MRSRFFVFALSFLLLFFVPGVSFATEGPVATVIELEGTATRTSGSLIKPLNIDDTINLDDTITTFAGSKILILFADDTEITLSENSKLTIDRYIFDPEGATPPQGTFNVLSGAFLLTSGLISKVAAPDVKINTSYGTIGLRGTTVWGGLLDGEYGVLVQEGEVDVTNKGGTTVVPKGQGTFMRNNLERPRLPKAWPQAKTDRAVKTILLERREMVKLKLEQEKTRNIARRAKHQEILKKRIDLPRDQKEKIQELKDRPVKRPVKRPYNK